MYRILLSNVLNENLSIDEFIDFHNNEYHAMKNIDAVVKRCNLQKEQKNLEITFLRNLIANGYGFEWATKATGKLNQHDLFITVKNKDMQHSFINSGLVLKLFFNFPDLIFLLICIDKVSLCCSVHLYFPILELSLIFANSFILIFVSSECVLPNIGLL